MQKLTQKTLFKFISKRENVTLKEIKEEFNLSKKKNT
jgi:hypothetical protein